MNILKGTNKRVVWFFLFILVLIVLFGFAKINNENNTSFTSNAIENIEKGIMSSIMGWYNIIGGGLLIGGIIFIIFKFSNLRNYY